MGTIAFGAPGGAPTWCSSSFYLIGTNEWIDLKRVRRRVNDRAGE
jgi:hypothetical protein